MAGIMRFINQMKNEAATIPTMFSERSEKNPMESASRIPSSASATEGMLVSVRKYNGMVVIASNMER